MAQRVGTVFAWCAALLVTTLSAQDRQVGGIGISIYEDVKFKGRNATVREAIPDLTRYGLFRQISSLRVAPGELWEGCEDVNFQGRCQVFSGEESDLRKVNWNDQIGSLRRVRGGSSNPGLYPPSNRSRIVLFDQTRYRGRSWTVDSAQSIISGAGRAQSLQIYGGTWEVCAGQNWTPPCLRLSESQSDLEDFGFDNRIVSVRPVGSRPR
jgi:hypothetical protein